MKTVCLLRHSKSDWDTPFSTDQERGLSSRGKKNAGELHKLFKKYNFFFDIAYVSGAKRTIETYQTISDKLEVCKSTRVDPLLYEAEPEYYLELLKKTKDSIESILIVGHNPGMEIFANYLIGNDFNSESLFTKFPTSALCIFNFQTNKWIDIPEKSKGSLYFFWIPDKGKEK
ncbi:MAG: histidine phosphatase family protein [Leptospiraceae bacterium]|nr:histidine phosphatase family protein [Leptospiraceae bacterium]